VAPGVAVLLSLAVWLPALRFCCPWLCGSQLCGSAAPAFAAGCRRRPVRSPCSATTDLWPRIPDARARRPAPRPTSGPRRLPRARRRPRARRPALEARPRARSPSPRSKPVPALEARPRARRRPRAATSVLLAASPLVKRLSDLGPASDSRPWASVSC